MTTRAVYSRVAVELDLDTLAEARRVTAAVLRALRDRLTADEADQAAAQLPRELKALWHGGPPAPPRPLKMHRQEFYERVKADAALPGLRTAAMATDAVFAALKDHISEGECNDIVAQLPRDLKSVWTHA
ncbi:MAG TPA: DUF2267 domain-containing protein [Methylomirabilota bacterium]|jgi:uncharacterized protein (DUF2267 family)|nr:DUF2267 domain-containing protein [Methylomirabilota bacterium]